MTRALQGKVKISGTLVAALPIAVGGSGAGEQVDLDLAVNGAGEVYVPGSSLTGPIRAWLASREEEAAVNELFGFISPGTDDGHASALFIEDGRVGKAALERRHGNAIDETSGTVKEKALYTRAILPRGTRVSLEMEMDLKTSNKEANPNKTNLKTLTRILKALQNGEIRFGACKTRGLGQLCLEDIKIDHYDFGNPKHLDAWLNGQPVGGEEFLKNHEAVGGDNSDRHVVKIEWRPISPLMVKSGRDGVSTDMLPLLSGSSGKLSPVIPGSSLKGVLRAQAEKILRTLAGTNNPNLAIVEELFGTSESAGRLAVDDVYCKEYISSQDWVREDSEALNRFSVHQQYVAIDRFTGGASEGALYSARPVKKEVVWEPIRLTLDFAGKGTTLLNEVEQNQIWGLLTLLLLDLKEGMIPIGFGTRRGLGEIEICSDIDHILPNKDELRDAWKQFIESGCNFRNALWENKGEEQ
jgi:CRISPR/Cas system CSM-associated protein Csm3 (group 7 of RAMP superfamily)